ncbi:ATP synthase F0 subcomplex subunit H atp14 [Emydomyces testavorans]|uniref:ATP synthase F0 subcomplex subunit H atp14 n=1 Tax=Emydomyces testavorans TaxID=2070801 RepID=A0AAF0DBF2_9EURO|nr:ATP synthase F0 subcomplex subunit H atp14 [Emydomyces testavorans]
MFQSLRASRSLLTRLARQQRPVAVRTFATSSARQGRREQQSSSLAFGADQRSTPADPVQELYLRELRGYKPPPVKPSDADAYVQKFVMPTPPVSPEEANIAADLKAYETQDVEVEGQAAPGEATAVEEDWFEMPEDEANTAH